jgi:hypothetical protein
LVVQIIVDSITHTHPKVRLIPRNLGSIFYKANDIACVTCPQSLYYNRKDSAEPLDDSRGTLIALK